MIPLLLFELIWKATHQLFFALPLYWKGQVLAGVADDTRQIILVAILVPLIPWSYVMRHYILKSGDRWKP